MTEQFIAHPPGDQSTDTYRQFTELQNYLERLEERLSPLYGAANVQPLVVVDAWQPLSFVEPVIRPIPTKNGVYFASVRLSMTGSTANATVQLRVTAGDEQVTGNIVTVGNNDLISVTLTGTFYLGSGAVLLEARGEQSEVLGGYFNIHRVGSGP